MQQQIGVQYDVYYSLDQGPRTFLECIDPYERPGGASAIQKMVSVPGYKRVNVQKDPARRPDGSWIDDFEIKTRDCRCILYVKRVGAP